ncbi:hypothetical protein DID78_05910, partial [Candidatus Marinamargulisbacteria bacterium SCGC AG-343-D04]
MNPTLKTLYVYQLKIANLLAEELSTLYKNDYTINNIELLNLPEEIEPFLTHSKKHIFIPFFCANRRGFIVLPPSLCHHFSQQFLGIDDTENTAPSSLLIEFIALRLSLYISQCFDQHGIILNHQEKIILGKSISINPQLEDYHLIQFNIENK